MQKPLSFVLCVLAGNGVACDDDTGLPGRLATPFAHAAPLPSYLSAPRRADFSDWERHQAEDAAAYERARPITVIDTSGEGPALQTWYPSFGGRVYSRY